MTDRDDMLDDDLYDPDPDVEIVEDDPEWIYEEAFDRARSKGASIPKALAYAEKARARFEGKPAPTETPEPRRAMTGEEAAAAVARGDMTREQAASALIQSKAEAAGILRHVEEPAERDEAREFVTSRLARDPDQAAVVAYKAGRDRGANDVEAMKLANEARDAQVANQAQIQPPPPPPDPDSPDPRDVALKAGLDVQAEPGASRAEAMGAYMRTAVEKAMAGDRRADVEHESYEPRYRD